LALSSRISAFSGSVFIGEVEGGLGPVRLPERHERLRAAELE